MNLLYRISHSIMLVLLSIFTSQLFAQAPDTLWTRTYGGPDNDYVYCVQQTIDGGYIMSGETWTGIPPVVLIIKTDSAGSLLWEATYGHESGRSEWIAQTNDAGYIFTGSKGNDVWLVKIDSLGDTLWTKTYGGSDFEHAWCVVQTNDGGYCICGRTESYGAGRSDAWLVKTDSLGDSVWAKTYGGPYDDVGRCVVQTEDMGYIITGYTNPYGAGNVDSWLIKTDSLGDTLWTKTYGGDNHDLAYEVVQTNDGGYFITGETASSGAGSQDLWLVKTDSLGDTVWTRAYGTAKREWGESGVQAIDSGYIVTGCAQAENGFFDVWIIRTNAVGETLWTKILGDSMDDYGESVKQTSDGGYIVAGWTDNFDTWSADAWLIRIASETGVVEDNTNAFNVRASSGILRSPAIATGDFDVAYDVLKRGTIVLSLYDIVGSEVTRIRESVLGPGSYKDEIKTTSLSNGIYFVVLRHDAESVSRKVFLVRR